MKETYLVQEGTFRIDSEVEKVDGIDSIVEFKYMGAAEFEFGALPQSLKRIAKNLEEYKAFPTRYVSHKKEKLFIFCKENDLSFVREMIKRMRKNNQHLKIGITFKRNFEEESRFIGNFWWDIDNDFFFFFGENQVEKVKTAMKNLRVRWHDELFPKKTKNKSFLNFFFKK